MHKREKRKRDRENTLRANPRNNSMTRQKGTTLTRTNQGI